MLLKVVGTNKTSVIFIADIWRPQNHADGRYLWMPAEIGDGKFWIPTPRPRTIDLLTGETSTSPTPPSPKATASPYIT